jgi:hypothetical protein
MKAVSGGNKIRGTQLFYFCPLPHYPVFGSISFYPYTQKVLLCNEITQNFVQNMKKHLSTIKHNVLLYSRLFFYKNYFFSD